MKEYVCSTVQCLSLATVKGLSFFHVECAGLGSWSDDAWGPGGFRLGIADQAMVVYRIARDGAPQHEYQSLPAAVAPVEPEDELAGVLVRVVGADGALVGAFEGSFYQREQAVHRWQRLACGPTGRGDVNGFCT